MGNTSIPIQKNVSPSYPKTPEKISDYIVKNIWTYIQKPSDNNKNPSVVGSFNLTKTLRNYYNDEKDQHHPNAYKNSVYRLEEYLSKNYPNGNLYAQTRIVASYGMLQETFYDASSKNLAGFSVGNSNQPPEFLNEMNYSMQAYLQRFGNITPQYPGDNWVNGFENGWKDMLGKYNPGEHGYNTDVIKNSMSFLPIQ